MNQLHLFKDTPEIIRGNSRICSKCKKKLPLKCFPKVRGLYYRPECKSCINGQLSARRKLRKIYPHPAEDYRCPICERHKDDILIQDSRNLRSPWVLDHCHETQEFRGWLCDRCNKLCGNATDDISVLKKAIKYLSNI